MQPGLLWSPQLWGRTSGNWGLFWSGSEDSSAGAGWTKQAGGGRWWPQRELGLIWVRLWVMEAGEGQREVLEQSFHFWRKQKTKKSLAEALLCGMGSCEPSWGSGLGGALEEEPSSELGLGLEQPRGPRELSTAVTAPEEQHAENPLLQPRF